MRAPALTRRPQLRHHPSVYIRTRPSNVSTSGKHSSKEREHFPWSLPIVSGYLLIDLLRVSLPHAACGIAIATPHFIPRREAQNPSAVRFGLWRVSDSIIAMHAIGIMPLRLHTASDWVALGDLITT